MPSLAGHTRHCDSDSVAVVGLVSGAHHSAACLRVRRVIFLFGLPLNRVCVTSCSSERESAPWFDIVHAFQIWSLRPSTVGTHTLCCFSQSATCGVSSLVLFSICTIYYYASSVVCYTAFKSSRRRRRRRQYASGYFDIFFNSALAPVSANWPSV